MHLIPLERFQRDSENLQIAKGFSHFQRLEMVCSHQHKLKAELETVWPDGFQFLLKVSRDQDLEKVHQMPSERFQGDFGNMQIA